MSPLIQTYRDADPDFYSQFSDDEIAEAVWSADEKLRSAMPLDQFRAAVIQPKPEPTNNQSFLGDAASYFGEGSNALLKLGGQAWGLASGDMDNWATRQGESGIDYWRDPSRRSDWARGAEQEIQQASQQAEDQDGQWSALGTYLWETAKRPGTIPLELMRQLPNLVGMGGVGNLAGRGALKLALKQNMAQDLALAQARKVGAGAAVMTEAAMNGAETGGEAFDRALELKDEIWEQYQPYQELKSQVGPEAAKLRLSLDVAREAALKSAGLTGAFGMIPGSQTLERFATGLGDIGGKGLGARMTKGGLKEGLEEGVIEEGGNQFFANQAVQQIDPNQSLAEGLGMAAAQGMVIGAPMGALAGAAQRPDAAAQLRQQHQAEAALRKQQADAQADAHLQQMQDAQDPEQVIAAAAAAANTPVEPDPIAVGIGEEQAEREWQQQMAEQFQAEQDAAAQAEADYLKAMQQQQKEQAKLAKQQEREAKQRAKAMQQVQAAPTLAGESGLAPPNYSQTPAGTGYASAYPDELRKANDGAFSTPVAAEHRLRVLDRNAADFNPAEYEITQVADGWVAKRKEVSNAGTDRGITGNDGASVEPGAGQRGGGIAGGIPAGTAAPAGALGADQQIPGAAPAQPLPGQPGGAFPNPGTPAPTGAEAAPAGGGVRGDAAAVAPPARTSTIADLQPGARVELDGGFGRGLPKGSYTVGGRTDTSVELLNADGRSAWIIFPRLMDRQDWRVVSQETATTPVVEPETPAGETQKPASFTPTHEASDGTPLQATDEPGIYLDADGFEVEEANATPLTQENKQNDEQGKRPQAQSGAQTETDGDTPQRGQAEAAGGTNADAPGDAGAVADGAGEGGLEIGTTIEFLDVFGRGGVFKPGDRAKVIAKNKRAVRLEKPDGAAPWELIADLNMYEDTYRVVDGKQAEAVAADPVATTPVAEAETRTQAPQETATDAAPAEKSAEKPFDAAAWDAEREGRIAASKASGNKHLDDLPRYVEGMRGQRFYNVHDPKESGVVRTVANTGDVVVHWDNQYSADKNLGSTKVLVGKGKNKKEVYESWLMPSDLKDYAVGKPAQAQTPQAAATETPQEPAENSPQTTIENQEAQTPKQTPAEPEKISYDKRLSRIKIDYTTADGETLEGINPMPLMRDLDDRLNGLQRLVNCIG